MKILKCQYFFYVLLFQMLPIFIIGQTTSKFNYQAVIRTSTNELLINTPVTVRIRIHRNSATGLLDYLEIHKPTTSPLGIITLEVGGGQNTSGNIADIDWNSFPYFLAVDIDPKNGTNYTITWATQLLSVPFSSYSNNAGYRPNGNTAIGKFAMASVNSTSGAPNTAVGYSALASNTTGHYSTALGYQALYSNTTGKDNEAIGMNALRDNVSGEANTAMGGNALLENVDGLHNVAIGHATLQKNKSGRYNTAVGSYVADNLLSGQNNTMIGFNIATQWTSGQGNVLIGNAVGNNNLHLNSSNKLIISNSNTQTPLIYGDFDNRTIKFNHYIDSPVVYNYLSFVDENANSHIGKYENNFPDPIMYARYMYGQYGDLVIQGTSKTYTGNIHFVTGSTVSGSDIPTQRMVITDNGKVGVGNFINSKPRSRLEVRDGDIYLPSSSNGIILTSPNGKCWRVTIDDNGNMIRTNISCPVY